MKKIIAIICTVAMLLSFTVTAFADEWDFLAAQYKSYDATMEFSFVLNKPLDCLALFNEEAGFDVKYMVEELTKAKYTMKVQAELGEDNLKGKMAMAINADVPVNLSEDLKFGADVTLYAWMDYDFTSEENAKYNVIVKNPLNGQFIVIDYFTVMTQTGIDMKSQLTEAFAALDLEAGVKEITELTKSLYKKHAKLEVKDNEYTVTLTNDGMIDLVFDAVTGYMNTEYAKNSGLDASMLDMEGVDLPTIQAVARGLGIFGDNDALVIKAKVNDKGQMTAVEESVHFDFNLVELFEALGEDTLMLYPVTKETGNIDVTIRTKTVYDKIDEENVVTFPTLTEENSASLMELIGSTMPEEDYIEPEYNYQSEYFWDYAQGMMDRNGMYAEAAGFIDSCYWDDDNLTGNVALAENGDVTMTLTSDNFGTVTVKGNLKSDEYMLNDIKLWARRPFKTASVYDWETYEGEEVVYVNMEVLNYILGAKVQTIQTYILDDEMKELTTPEYYFDIVRPNPAYVPSEQ